MTRSTSYNEIVKRVLAADDIDIFDKGETKPARRALRRCAEELRALGKHQMADEFEDRHIGEVHRGRVTPSPGEGREYRVQEQNGTLIIRVPVSMLGARAGDSVRVDFSRDRFTGQLATKASEQTQPVPPQSEATSERPHGFLCVEGVWHAVDVDGASMCGEIDDGPHKKLVHVDVPSKMNAKNICAECRAETPVNFWVEE